MTIFLVFQRVAELDEITQIRDRARKRHDDLRKTRLNEFMEGFGIITGKLKEIYQMNNRFFFSFYSPILSFLRILNSWPGYDVDR